MIYLDNAATTRPFDRVIKMASLVTKIYFGNPSSLHRLGVVASEQLMIARRKIAEFAGVPENWVIFTSGATEANQTVLLGGTRSPNKKRNHILLSGFEHPSVREASRVLEERGYEVEYIMPDREGVILPEIVQSYIRPETEMVSIIGVHNEIGVIQDIAKIKHAIKVVNKKTLFHVDAVQWFAKKRLPSVESMPDFLTFSAHKFHGPKGVGGIIKSPGRDMKPLICGGGQEWNLRSGTENLAAIAGAAEALQNIKLEEKYKKMTLLQKELYSLVSSKEDLVWLGPEPGKNRSPYISLFSYRGKKSEIFIHELEAAGIFVSSGSACSEKGKKRQLFWELSEYPPEVVDGIIRVSFGYLTKDNDVRKFCDELDKRT